LSTTLLGTHRNQDTAVGQSYAKEDILTTLLTDRFMAGYNFFIYEALLIPFEITALSTVLNFWSDDIPGWAIPLACIVSLKGFSSCSPLLT
jgi:L-asparagine transporter-like permease